MAQHVPMNMRKLPPFHRGRVNPQVVQIHHLGPTVKQQLGLRGRSRSGRMILHQDKRRRAQVRMFRMECNLMRAKVYFSPTFHHLKLDHDKKPLALQCDQAVRNPQVHPRFDPGYVAVLQVFPDPFVKCCFGFYRHSVPRLD